MVGAQQTTEDADGRLKQVHVRVLAEGQLLFHPALCFCKLWSDAQDNTQRQRFNVICDELIKPPVSSVYHYKTFPRSAPNMRHIYQEDAVKSSELHKLDWHLLAAGH